MKKKAIISVCMTFFIIVSILPGCKATNSNSPTIYPLEFTSDLEDKLTEMPKTCYTTTAEENGLGGNVYSVTGTVASVLSEDETIADVGEMFSVENDEGTAWFVVATPEFFAENENVRVSSFDNLMDDTMDYTLPEEGEFVTIYGIYSGYSSAYESPLLYFGIDEFLYTLINNKAVTSSTSTQSNEESVISSSSLYDCPLVTYDDILTGKYNGQNISIECIVDRINIKNETSVSFSLWFPSGETYIYVGSTTNSFFDVTEDSPESIFLNAQNGDVIRYATSVYDDGSLGTANITAADIVGKEDLINVYNTYKSKCPNMNYEDIQRNPQNYEDTSLKLTGSIFQIIDESAYSASYLVSTDFGYVYASWYDDEEIRGTRFLEGDNIVLYGDFEMLKTYDTPLGTQNTVPQISVCIMELR